MEKKFKWVDDYFENILSVDARATLYVDRLKGHEDNMSAVYAEIDTKIAKIPTPSHVGRKFASVPIIKH